MFFRLVYSLAVLRLVRRDKGTSLIRYTNPAQSGDKVENDWQSAESCPGYQPANRFAHAKRMGRSATIKSYDKSEQPNAR